MRRLRFTVAEAEIEAVLDDVLHLLPRGARVLPTAGRVRLEALGPALPSRDVLEQAARHPLGDWTEDEVAADWQHRRSAGVPVAGRVLIRAPEDPPAPEGVLDVVIAWAADGFGSGSHPTTRMCTELLLGLEPGGGLLDVGCGLGTLAIVGARLGYGPVVGVDRDAAAIEGARGNAVRNAVDVAFDVLDAGEADLPYQPTIVANAPPAVQARIAMRLPPDTRAVVVSGVMAAEAEHVVDAYAAAGLAPTVHRVDDDELWVALLLEPARG